MSHKSYSKSILENIFGSKAKILKLFFQYPQLTLSIEDICKKTGIKNKLGKQSIASLVRLGILKRANNHDKKNKTKKK